jgi:enoyl-CoA hydratase/carnithine racemase
VVELVRQDAVFILDVGDGENRFHPDWIAAVDAALDEVERATGPRSLVTTATGKFFSNGLDLAWVDAHREQYEAYVLSVHRLYARLLALPLTTVAAIQGHAFAAGAMLVLAQDLRVMRSDRGFWSLPEVAIGIPFTSAMAALVQARLAPQVAHVAMTTAHRYGGDEAAALGIVDRAVDEAEVLPAATALAASLAGHAGETLGTVKERMYAPVLRALRSTDRPLE